MLNKIIHLKCLILYTEVLILNLSFFYVIKFCEINSVYNPIFSSCFFFLKQKKENSVRWP